MGSFLAGRAARRAADRWCERRRPRSAADYRVDRIVSPAPVRPYREVQFCWENERGP